MLLTKPQLYLFCGNRSELLEHYPHPLFQLYNIYKVNVWKLDQSLDYHQ